jgi:hypothetical protein
VELARKVTQGMLDAAQMLVVTLEIQRHDARREVLPNLDELALDAAVPKICREFQRCPFETLSDGLALLALHVGR